MSATLTRTCEFIDNRATPVAEEVLRDFADTIGRLGPQIFPQTPVALVLCPEHAQQFAGAGYSKADVQNWLIEHSGRTAGEMRRAGKGHVLRFPVGGNQPGFGASAPRAAAASSPPAVPRR